MPRYRKKALKFRTIPIKPRSGLLIDNRSRDKESQILTPNLSELKIRKEGIKQIGKAIASQNPIVGTFELAKDLSIGGYKAIDPKGFKKNKIVRKLDEF